MRGLKYLTVWAVMIGTVVLAAATCTPTPGMVQRNPPGVMMRMMGMGDMASGLSNVNKLMPMPADERMAHMNKAETEALERGSELFHDTKLGTSGLACASCHPNGGTTGGETQLPMTSYMVPIPDLRGAAGTFPKFKVPNNRVITLEEMDTNCLRMFVLGDYISDEDSNALAMYVTSLSKGQTIEVGK